ncbi:MAG TPA: universal stress protein [Streptosporangiaceae bacterium]|nr:universal stress protein [Streptosporangiaceae bacterium]
MSGIVVGIDGSHNASHALQWAMAEAAVRKTHLTVITVNSVVAGYWSGGPVTLPGDEERVANIRKLAEEAVAKEAARLGDSQPESVTVSAFSGFPAQALIEASKDTDLLVVGTRGGGGFATLRMGSIASQVVHHAHCPVVVVHSGS